MPNYNLRIKWTEKGKGGNHQDRIDDAIAAAGRHSVKGHNGNEDLKRSHREEESDGWHIQWHVHGTAAKVKAMVDEWVSNQNVIRVSITPPVD